MEIFAGAFRTLPNYTGTSDVALHSMGKPSPSLSMVGETKIGEGGGNETPETEFWGKGEIQLDFYFSLLLRSVGRSVAVSDANSIAAPFLRHVAPHQREKGAKK